MTASFLPIPRTMASNLNDQSNLSERLQLLQVLGYSDLDMPCRASGVHSNKRSRANGDMLSRHWPLGNPEMFLQLHWTKTNISSSFLRKRTFHFRGCSCCQRAHLSYRKSHCDTCGGRLYVSASALRRNHQQANSQPTYLYPKHRAPRRLPVSTADIRTYV